MDSLSFLTRLRYRIEGRALAVAVYLFRLIPVDIASTLMGFLWRVFAPLNVRHKRALLHLEHALPEIGETRRREIVSAMWDNLGRVTAETFHNRDLVCKDERFEVVVDDTTQRVLSGKGQAVFVSLHSGNWEVCIHPIIKHGRTVAGVYQALKNPYADQVVRQMREDLYQLGLYSKGHRTARKLLSLVRQGGLVALMADLRETRGIKVRFFGRQAYANPIPASLARAGKIPIVAARVIRLKGARFQIEASTIQVPLTADRKADIQKATEDLHQLFEKWIRENPEQWMWIHRKWAQT